MHEVQVGLILVGADVGGGLGGHAQGGPRLTAVCRAEEVQLGRLCFRAGALGGGEGVDHGIARGPYPQGGATSASVRGARNGRPGGAAICALEEAASTV